jgi:hypothetical protein
MVRQSGHDRRSFFACLATSAPTICAGEYPTRQAPSSAKITTSIHSTTSDGSASISRNSFRM